MLKRSVVVLAIAAIVTVLAAQPLAVQASAAQTTQVRIATLFDLLTDVEGTELDQEPTPLRRRDGPETEEPVGWTDIQDLVLLDVELSERAADALVTALTAHEDDDLLVSTIGTTDPTRVWEAFIVRVDQHIPRPIPGTFSLTVGCRENEGPYFMGPDVDAQFNSGSWFFLGGDPLQAGRNEFTGGEFVDRRTGAFAMTTEDIMLAMVPTVEAADCTPYQVTVGSHPDGGSWDRFTYLTDDAPPLLPSAVQVELADTGFVLRDDPLAADTVGDESVGAGVWIGIAAGLAAITALGLAMVLLRSRAGRALP